MVDRHARPGGEGVGPRRNAGDGALADDLSRTVGQTGAAHPGPAAGRRRPRPTAGQRRAGVGVVLVHLADGADVVVLRTTGAPGRLAADPPGGRPGGRRAPLPYGKFLSWRGCSPPSRPAGPSRHRVSSPAAWRSEDWKFGFVGSKDRASGAVHLPPARVSMQGGAVDDMEPAPMADARGHGRHLHRGPHGLLAQPPHRLRRVDFDGGGRFPVELTDVDADALAIGDRVEMTFRRLFTADGIHDYFWKARPVRDPGRRGRRRARGPGGPMASHGIRDRVAIVGMGCTNSASTGTRASTT